VARRDINLILNQIRKIAEETGVSDAELLGRFIATRDEAAFELLVRRHADLVSGVCRRVLRDFHDAEDAMQATFLALARQASRIRNHESLTSWLYRVAFRAALIIRAKRIKHEAKTHSLAAAGEIVARVSHAGEESRDSQALLDHEVNRLPERFRSPIVLCYLEGKTVDEAALLLGAPRGTVASRLARGRKRLHDRLNRRGVELGAGLAALSRAQIPPEAVSTILAVARKAASAADGVISPKVLAITEEVLRAMFFQKLKTATVAIVVLAGILLVGGGWAFRSAAFGQADDPPPAAEQNPPAKPVATVQAGKEKPADPPSALPLAIVIHPIKVEQTPSAGFVGRLEPLQTVQIRAQDSGRLEKVCYQAGAEVKKGDVLFEIDSPTYRTAVRKAEADMSAALAQEKQSNAEIARFRAVDQEGPALTANERARKAAAEAAVHMAKMELERAKHDLESNVRITAPISGQIGRWLVDPGNHVFSTKDNATLLATITSIDPIVVSFEMDERSLLWYQRQFRERRLKIAGSPLLVRLSDGQGFIHKGSLEGFDGRVDPATGKVQARGIMPNPDKLCLPGMQVRVRMTMVEPRPVLQLPAGWESLHQAQPFVLVINDENRVERRDVTFKEITQGNMAVIEEGLRPNDRVIVDDRGIKVGDRVKPRLTELQR
jgi:RND family efflux transporter MFP subunit